MLCPYCKQVMSDGFLAGDKIIVWSKNKKEGKDEWLDKEAGDVLVCKRPNIFKSQANKEASYCEHCKVLIAHL